MYLIHEFLFLNFQIHRISTLSFRLLSIDKSDNMLHSPSGFPSRISCRIIGCDFSSLDTFTYCLLKAVFHKYHAAEFIMRWRLLGAHNSPRLCQHYLCRLPLVEIALEELYLLIFLWNGLSLLVFQILELSRYSQIHQVDT